MLKGSGSGDNVKGTKGFQQKECKMAAVTLYEPPKHFLLFTYGTLMRGYWNNFYLDNARYLGDFQTCVKFSFSILNGGIPAVKESWGSCPANMLAPVEGELWKVPFEDKDNLDTLEGHPDFYKRCVIIAESLNTGEKISNVTMYRHLPAVNSSRYKTPNDKGTHSFKTFVSPS